MAIIVGREEVAKRRVTDNPHIDPIPTPDVLLDDSRHSGIECYGTRPSPGVADIRIRRVRRVVVLVD